MGFFILWFGFFAFNAGSEGGVVGPDFDPGVVGRAAVNTALAAGAAIISSLALAKFSVGKDEISIFGKELQIVTIFGGYWSVNAAVNGGLTGMVAICAGCDCVEPWAAFVIGLIAGKLFKVIIYKNVINPILIGVVFTFFARFVLELGIDDPVTAAAIHLFGGIWGIISVGLFTNSDRLDVVPGGGILYAWDGDAFLFMGVQLIGVTVICLWSAVICGLFFGILRIAGLLRVTPEQEKDGLDFIDGEPAYPMDPAVIAAFAPDYSDEDQGSDTF